MSDDDDDTIEYEIEVISSSSSCVSLNVSNEHAEPVRSEQSESSIKPVESEIVRCTGGQMREECLETISEPAEQASKCVADEKRDTCLKSEPSDEVLGDIYLLRSTEVEDSISPETNAKLADRQQNSVAGETKLQDSTKVSEISCDQTRGEPAQPSGVESCAPVAANTLDDQHDKEPSSIPIESKNKDADEEDKVPNQQREQHDDKPAATNRSAHDAPLGQQSELPALAQAGAEQAAKVADLNESGAPPNDVAALQVSVSEVANAAAADNDGKANQKDLVDDRSLAAAHDAKPAAGSTDLADRGRDNRAVGGGKEEPERAGWSLVGVSPAELAENGWLLVENKIEFQIVDVDSTPVHTSAAPTRVQSEANLSCDHVAVQLAEPQKGAAEASLPAAGEATTDADGAEVSAELDADRAGDNLSAMSGAGESSLPSAAADPHADADGGGGGGGSDHDADDVHEALADAEKRRLGPGDAPCQLGPAIDIVEVDFAPTTTGDNDDDAAAADDDYASPGEDVADDLLLASCLVSRKPRLSFSEDLAEDLEREFDEEPDFERRQVEVKRDSEFANEYELGEELGRGRFGTVSRCTELTSGRRLAAKFVHLRRREDRVDVEREIAIMSVLQHKRLLQLYDAFDDGRNEMCLVTELVAGGELFERIVDDDFELTEQKAAIFMRQICEGVDYMQSQQIVHLDMKPENILCLSRTSNRIKLIDFGLARRLDPGEPLRVMFGTPDFAAPEVLTYEPVSLATDMWSVGVICYVLLSGLSPFMGDNDLETMANVMKATYDFESQAFDPISELARDFISRLLVREPGGRMRPAECLQHAWLQRGGAQLVAAVRERRESTASIMINNPHQFQSAAGLAAAAAVAATTTTTSMAATGAPSAPPVGTPPEPNATPLPNYNGGAASPTLSLAETSSSLVSLDKRNLKRYVVRRKWHKTVHAIMALGRMGANLRNKL